LEIGGFKVFIFALLEIDIVAGVIMGISNDNGGVSLLEMVVADVID
jgi:hypothetical protein